MWLKADHVDLRQITHVAPVQYRDIRGHKIAYRDMGSGPVVFCMPPWPFSSIAYTPLAKAIGRHVRLICMDMPGWGGNTPAISEHPTIDQMGELAADFIRSFEIADYSILGWSYGGVVTQWLTDHNQAQPHKIALVSTMHDGKGVYKAYGSRVSFYRTARRLHMPKFLIKAIAVWIIKRDYVAGEYLNTVVDTPILQASIKDTLRLDLDSAIGSALNLGHTEVIHNHAFPTQALVIYAENDLPSLREESIEMARSLGVEPITIDDVGHDHLFFVVNRSAEIILNFLLA